MLHCIIINSVNELSNPIFEVGTYKFIWKKIFYNNGWVLNILGI